MVTRVVTLLLLATPAEHGIIRDVYYYGNQLQAMFSGTPVDQWPCNSISNERWSWPHSFPDGMWPIRSQVAGSSSYCLDVPGASTQAGLGVQIYTCNGTSAQAWGIVGPVA